MKTEELIKGQLYHVEYMPTKYLYKRIGIFREETKTSLIFDIAASDKEFFSFNKKFLKSLRRSCFTIMPADALIAALNKKTE
jgi:hypothetical protein